MSILGAPAEVQRAFQAKELKLVDAARVGTLSKNDRLRFAVRLRAGDDAQAVYADFFPPRPGTHIKASDALAAFIRSLGKVHADLSDRVDRVHPNLVRQNEAELRRGRKLIRALLKKIEPDPE